MAGTARRRLEANSPRFTRRAAHGELALPEWDGLSGGPLERIGAPPGPVPWRESRPARFARSLTRRGSTGCPRVDGTVDNFAGVRPKFVDKSVVALVADRYRSVCPKGPVVPTPDR